MGQGLEETDLVVPQDVAARVRRPGDGHGAHFRMRVEIGLHGLAVQQVLEAAVAVELALGRKADEGALLYALVSVADVLGHEGEEDGALHSLRHAAEHVEEVEHGALTAIGQGDVGSAYRPAVLAAEEGGDRIQRADAALGRVVVGDQVLEGLSLSKEILEPSAVGHLHLADAGRVPSSEGSDAHTFGKGARDVVHELEDA